MNPRVRDKLCQILAKYGTSLHLDPRRCENLLRDLCPHHKREVHVLVGALRERVPADLASPLLQKSVAASMGRLSKRLEDNLALAEAPARWAVETWALALGVITAQQLKAAQLPRQMPQKARVAPPVIVARRQTSVLSCALVMTICLLLAGSGVGLAVYWNPSPREQLGTKPMHDSSRTPALHGSGAKPIAFLSGDAPVLPAPAESQERSAPPTAQPADDTFPPISAEEIETARGALLPQAPFVIPESSL